MKISKDQLKLYLVTDPILCKSFGLVETVKEAVKGGVTIVQLRDKFSAKKDLIKTGKILKKILINSKIPLIINDDVEAAIESGADGVHIGKNDMPLESVRSYVGKNMIVGFSCESVSDIKSLKSDVVDYIGISPVFKTNTKTDFSKYLGLEGLKKLSSLTSIPKVAIGGIKKSHCHDIFSCGVDGIAVVSAICGQEDPFTASKELVTEIKKTINNF